MNPNITFLTLIGILTMHTLSAQDAVDLKALTARAEGGDTGAQVELAVRYRDGRGVAKDEVLAMQWGHRAADRGDAAAMDFVGHAYLRGAIVERRPEIAFAYFKAAAERSAQAAFNLGQCYFGAQGTEQDIPAALESWKQAASGGHARAASLRWGSWSSPPSTC